MSSFADKTGKRGDARRRWWHVTRQGGAPGTRRYADAPEGATYAAVHDTFTDYDQTLGGAEREGD